MILLLSLQDGIKKRGEEAILEIGLRLTEAKALVQHGKWTKWLEDNFDLSAEMARMYMRVAEEFSKRSPVTGLGVVKASILLRLPQADRDSFMAKTHVVGDAEKSVGEMSKRQLNEAVKAYKKARIAPPADATGEQEDLSKDRDPCNTEEGEPSDPLAAFVSSIDDLEKIMDKILETLVGQVNNPEYENALNMFVGVVNKNLQKLPSFPPNEELPE